MLSKMSEYGKSLIKTSLFWLKMKNCSKHVGKYWIKLAMQKGFDSEKVYNGKCLKTKKSL